MSPIDVSLRVFVLTVYIVAIVTSAFLAYSRVITGDDFMKVIIFILGSIPGAVYTFFRDRLARSSVNRG